MSLWIKLCGNTTLADALLAAEAGADAAGFVFAPSPRRVTAAQVADLAPRLPQSLEKIGVFVDASFAEIAATVDAAGLTGVQLHFEAPPALPARLRERFGARLRILRVVHFEARQFDPAAGARLDAMAADANLDALLVDARTVSAAGGTGQTYDWNLARQAIFRRAESRKLLVAAGGLTAENVAEAISTLRPWGVDAVSGIEAGPGRKDPDKVRAFVEHARAAEAAR